MFKFFVKNNQMIDENIIIYGTDVNHIINVLRLQSGEKIQVCDIDTSKNYIVQIEKFDKEKVVSKIIENIEISTESNIKLDIYQGLPKSDKMELIIQKTTELGVNKIIPVEMERSIVKINSKDEIKKIDRWQKIAEVAAKQSKRDIIPEVKNIIKIKDVCDMIKKYDCFIVAYEEEENIKIKEILKQIENQDEIKIGVLIGPEGGIDKKEIELLIKNNAKIVTLGKRILRTETAPITIASIIMYELEK